MGKGDKKSKKGKIFKGSFGVSRKKNSIAVRLKKAAAKKTETASAEPAAAKPKRAAKKKAEA